MLTRNSPFARRLRALRDDAALREAEGVFVAEGVHLALEALAAQVPIEAALVAPRLSGSPEGRALSERLRRAGVVTHEASDGVIDQLQDARSPQPVLLLVKRAEASLAAVLSGRGGTPLLVVACGVQEPGNLGALWRTADAAGGTGFLATPGSASLTHPRTVRASMGSIFRLPAVEAGLEETLEDVRSRGFRVYGADSKNATAYDQVEWNGPIALLLGGEGAGLPAAAGAHLAGRVGVPMAPGVESLSVNAAAAVILFEAARKRRAVSGA